MIRGRFSIMPISSRLCEGNTTKPLHHVTVAHILNALKSKALILGPSTKISAIDLNARFSLNDQYLEYVRVYNYLGIMLDQKMSFLPLLSRLKTIISNKIYSLVKIRDFMTTKCALTIIIQTDYTTSFRLLRLCYYIM